MPSVLIWLVPRVRLATVQDQGDVRARRQIRKRSSGGNEGKRMKSFAIVLSYLAGYSVAEIL